MKIRKLMAVLLGALLIAGTFSAVSAQAATGPNTNAGTCAYIVAMDDKGRNDYAFDGISAEYRQYYGTSSGDKYSGMSYDKKTNTLTLEKCNIPHLEVNEMGDDFKIKLVGDCKVGLVSIWGYGYGGSVTVTGSGTLTAEAFYLNAEKTKATFTVTESATVKLASTSGKSLFYISDTYVAKDAVKADYDGKITVSELTNYKRQNLSFSDGYSYSFPILTKDGAKYYLNVADEYSGATIVGTTYDIYGLSGTQFSLVASYASEKEMKAAGYNYELDTPSYDYKSESGKSITFKALKTEKKDDTSKNQAETLAKGDETVVDGAKYKVTKVGTAKNAGTVTFVSPKSGASSVTIPATIKVGDVTYKVTAIDSSAFAGNKSITSVTIGENVKKIGKKAFSKCANLTSITIKSTTLTEKNVKGSSFKGVSTKCVVTVPSGKASDYKTILQKAGLDTKVTVK